MPIEVSLAKLSPTMESGQLVKWNVKVGDRVKEGDTLAEVQTDKAVMPMESFHDGTVAVLDAKEGDEIALGQRVLVLAKKGEDPQEIAKKLAGGVAKPSNSAPKQEAEAPKPEEPGLPREKGHGGSENGHDGASQGTSVAPAHAATAVAESPGGRIKVSPLARKMAQAAGIDLANLRGSGPGGRIVRNDVLAFQTSGPLQTRSTVSPRQTRRIPHTRMRQTIAQRMLQAKQSAPEIHLTSEVRMDRVVSVREQVNALYAPEKVKVSISDFITKGVAAALRRQPALNASWESDAIVQHGSINIGIAVALEGGLIVPVLQNADQLDLKQIRQGTQALAEAARANKLTSSQMMGSTFTISNLGMYGIKQFDAILNLPEVAILAVGGTEQRPVVENGQIVVGWLMSMTLTCDHRAVDGATGAEFMRTLKMLLEEPALMLMD